MRSYIPEGTAVSANYYTIQRDPRNFFPDAEVFWPERWFIAEKKDFVACPSSSSSPESSPPLFLTCPRGFVHNMDAFIPFSYGPENCVGKHLALQQIKTLVCHMMQRVDMTFAEGYDGQTWFEEMKEYAVLKVFYFIFETGASLGKSV